MTSEAILLVQRNRLAITSLKELRAPMVLGAQAA